VTARWAVEQVQPERDLTIIWEPISLHYKNEVDPEEQPERYERYWRTHRLLRVLESVRTTDGNDGVFRLYWEFGRNIHHDKRLLEFSVTEALSAVGLDTSHADAYDDESWDAGIRERMDVGLELAGDNIGTPIIAFDDAEGSRVGIFGPVITRVPNRELSLQLWDGLQQVMTVPGFWELKRTRTERPDFGERP
jgi:hypothetical protein